MKYKLVLLDMDGTLLNSKNEISKRNLEAIRAAEEQGIRVTIATGRVFTSAKIYAKQVGINTPMIACNGALIKDHLTNEVLYQNLLSKEALINTLEICQRSGVYFHFYDDERFFVEKKFLDYFKQYVMTRNAENEGLIPYTIMEDAKAYVEANEVKALKVLMVDLGNSHLDALREELMVVPGITVEKSWYNNLEVMNHGVSKGNGLSILGEYLGFKQEEMIAFGDNFNDLSMAAAAGAFVAMGNAEEIVKEKATYVTASNDEDGVALGIEKYVLGR